MKIRLLPRLLGKQSGSPTLPRHSSARWNPQIRRWGFLKLASIDRYPLGMSLWGIELAFLKADFWIPACAGMTAGRVDFLFYTHITSFMVILNENINPQIAADGFAALGSLARLQVVLCLVRAGDKGLSVGDIQDRTKIPASTLAHHLRALVNAQLVGQTKNGRTIINKAQYSHLEALAGYLLKECCSDE